MKSIVVVAMEDPFHVNPLTWLNTFWKFPSFYDIHSLSFSLTKITIVQVLGSVEDEQTFSTFSWNQNLETTSINTYTWLLICILKLYTLRTFSHMMHVLMIGRNKNLCKVWIDYNGMSPIWSECLISIHCPLCFIMYYIPILSLSLCVICTLNVHYVWTFVYVGVLCLTFKS